MILSGQVIEAISGFHKGFETIGEPCGWRVIDDVVVKVDHVFASRHPARVGHKLTHTRVRLDGEAVF